MLIALVEIGSGSEAASATPEAIAMQYITISKAALPIWRLCFASTLFLNITTPFSHLVGPMRLPYMLFVRALLFF